MANPILARLPLPWRQLRDRACVLLAALVVQRSVESAHVERSSGVQHTRMSFEKVKPFRNSPDDDPLNTQVLQEGRRLGMENVGSS